MGLFDACIPPLCHSQDGEQELNKALGLQSSS